MKKLIFSLLAIFVILGATAQDLTLAEVLAKHYSAINQEKRKDLQNLAYEGIMHMGTVVPIKVIIQRPGKIRLEGKVMEGSFVQTYDGKNAYMALSNASGLREIVGSEKENMERMASVDSDLYTVQKKAYDMKLLSKDWVGDVFAYTIWAKINEKEEAIFYLHPQNFLILKSRFKIKREGEVIESETVYGNYAEVDGMLFPKLYQQYNAEGKLLSEMEIKSIKLNIPTREEQFSVSK